MLDRTRIFDLLDVKVGSLSITNIRKDRWGHTITLNLVYSYPPEEKPFKLIFKDCQVFELHILKARSELPRGKVMPVTTHELGQSDYQHEARIVTTVVEVVISYGEVVVEKDW